jgi:hypothetical protein
MYQEARDSYISKFDSPFTAWLWDRTLDGGADAETGDADTFGWYGLMGRNILCQVSTGYVMRERFASATAAREYFDKLETEYCESFDPEGE